MKCRRQQKLTDRLERFFTDFENVYNDIQGYLKTKDTVKTDVMNSFLTGFKLCVDNLKSDIK